MKSPARKAYDRAAETLRRAARDYVDSGRMAYADQGTAWRGLERAAVAYTEARARWATEVADRVTTRLREVKP